MPPYVISDSRLDGRELASLFAVCLEQGTPATIATSDMTAACQALFAGGSEKTGTIEFDILANVDEHFSGYLSYCVSFSQRRRTWLFVAQQRAFAPAGPNGIPRLELKTPSHIIAADIRRVARVPVPTDAGLEVRLMSSDSTPLEGEVIDVGLGGMAILLPESHSGDHPVGSTIVAELRLGRDAIKLNAEVRHCEGRHLGLMFPEISTGEVFEAPEPYRRIIRSLEAKWFATLKRR